MWALMLSGLPQLTNLLLTAVRTSDLLLDALMPVVDHSTPCVHLRRVTIDASEGPEFAPSSWMRLTLPQRIEINPFLVRPIISITP